MPKVKIIKTGVKWLNVVKSEIKHEKIGLFLVIKTINSPNSARYKIFFYWAKYTFFWN